jgi:protein TonB
MLRLHAHTSGLQLNGLRIAGTSAAIALHALVLMLLFVPTTWAPPKIVVAEDPPVIPLDPPTIKPEVVTHVVTPTTKKPKPANMAPTTKPVATQEIVATSDTGPQIANTDVVPQSFGDTEPASTAAAELSADIAPAPPYPALALRAGTTGMVILRIRVDAQGRPVEGRVEKSSGSRLLDQTALKFVLARWHFNPAMQGGLPIVSDALVPIAFTLD